MMTQPVTNLPASLTAASDALVTALRTLPEFGAYQEASARAYADADIQQRISAIQELQNQLFINWSAEEEERLEGLEHDLLALPPMQTYATAECALREALVAVDAVISAAAGVPFAANARRGCGCGK
ncbi:MAG TPA: YlbF family regulator [Anaerolineae bacterium]|nr:YlbF family regulator [Anaerolineae bacterium]HQK13734.1 YlbF family regulator [Anaerolineae bacterium]